MNFSIITLTICVLAVFQPTHDRRVIAFVYALVIAVHGIVCANFEGFWYFFSAGVFDLCVISIVCAYKAVTRLTDDLINISVASIALNAYGFTTWFNEQPILSYQLTMVALYFIAILSLLRKECAGGNQPFKWHSSIRLFIDKSVSAYYSTQKAGKS